MFRVSRPPTAESSECRSRVEVPPPSERLRAVNVRLPAIRFLKQWLGWADPSAVNSGFGYRVRARLASQRGFTLIEVLVSALITTLIATAVAGALITNTDIIANQNSRSQAETLAEQDQERLKGLSAEQLDNLSQTYNVTVGGATYTISSKAWYLSTSNGQSCTTAGGASATYFKTISTVTRTNAQGKTATLATDESVITPPAGGSLLAQFHDQTASPLSGVSLAAAGPENDTGTSDTSGCVIFSALDSGTYNLTYTDLGYVDPNGNASPITDTATVASTGIASPGKRKPDRARAGRRASGETSRRPVPPLETPRTQAGCHGSAAAAPVFRWPPTVTRRRRRRSRRRSQPPTWRAPRGRACSRSCRPRIR